MKFEHDREADAIYVYLSSRPYARGVDLDNERRIDYAADGSAIGVELLCVSGGVNVASLPYEEDIAKLLVGQGIDWYRPGLYPTTVARPITTMVLTSSIEAEVLKVVSDEFSIRTGSIEDPPYLQFGKEERYQHERVGEEVTV